MSWKISEAEKNQKKNHSNISLLISFLYSKQQAEQKQNSTHEIWIWINHHITYWQKKDSLTAISKTISDNISKKKFRMIFQQQKQSDQKQRKIRWSKYSLNTCFSSEYDHNLTNIYFNNFAILVWILQYNVWKNCKIMILLLTDSEIADINIITVQKFYW